jgi:hypothetical protein
MYWRLLVNRFSLCDASLADERLLAQLVQEVRDAFQEESFLFKEA